MTTIDFSTLPIGTKLVVGGRLRTDPTWTYGQDKMEIGDEVVFDRQVGSETIEVLHPASATGKYYVASDELELPDEAPVHTAKFGDLAAGALFRVLKEEAEDGGQGLFMKLEEKHKGYPAVVIVPRSRAVPAGDTTGWDDDSIVEVVDIPGRL